eukprot:m.201640 g.201640  ORF g.201640 m.201640 type:complete len:73 (-) comp15747_c0_seq2:1158-1376(-)
MLSMNRFKPPEWLADAIAKNIIRAAPEKRVSLGRTSLLVVCIKWINRITSYTHAPMECPKPTKGMRTLYQTG